MGNARDFCLKDHKTIGKVAVFVNNCYEQKQPTGGIGFLTVLMISRQLILFSIIVRNGFRKREWKQWMALSISGKGINSGGF